MELPKMKLTSASGSEINLEALYQICPSCFTEVKDEKTGDLTHKINFSTLRELLGDNAFEGADEEYVTMRYITAKSRKVVIIPITFWFLPTSSVRE